MLSLFLSAVVLLNGAAETPPARPTKNMTVYRVTPVNLTGVADRNTGDDGGDVFFTLYLSILPVYVR